jgi:menaquinone-dependent protoporphyrinogen oxidase
MKVLVTAASKHGATDEVAEAIAEVLARANVAVEVVPPEEVRSLDAYDAVVLGSAVYAGHWLAPARGFVERFVGALRARPVWLFSTGPLGDPPRPGEDPSDAAPMLAATGAREHVVFGGRLERRELGLAERAIVAAVRAPDGDYRDWQRIRDWAEGIAEVVAAAGPDGVPAAPGAPAGPAAPAGVS